MMGKLWQRACSQWGKQPASLVMAIVVLIGLAGIAAYYFGYRNYLGREYRRRAEAAIASYDFPSARESLAKCLEVWPNDAATHFLMARTCRRLADFSCADEHLESALRLGHPQDEVDLEMILRVAQVEGLPPSRIQALSRYVRERCPEELLILEALATGFHRQQRYMEAGHWLNYWVRNYPADWRARHWRGSYFLQIGQPNAAEQDFRRSLELNPDYLEARRGLGLTLLKTGTDFEKGREHLQAYLRANPDDVTALVALARCHRRLNQPVEARGAIEKALALQPQSGTALLLMGLLASDEDDLPRALEYLERADGQTFHDTEDAHTLVSTLASVCQRLGQSDRAKAFQERLTRFNQDLRKLNEYVEKLTTGNAETEVAIEVGTIYLRMGLHEDGDRWLLGVLQRNPHDRRAHEALLEHYARRTDPESQRRADFHRQALQQGENP